MRKVVYLLVYSVMIFNITFFTGCSKHQVSKASEDEGEKLQRIFARQEQCLLDYDLEWAVSMCHKSKAGELNDYSLAGIEKQYRHWQECLEKLKTIDPSLLSKEERLNYDLLTYILEMEIEGHRFKGYLRPIHQLDGIHLNIMTLASYTVCRTETDYRNYLSRLNHVPRVLAETIEKMKQGLAENITYPKKAVTAVADQIGFFLKDNPEEIILYMPFKDMPQGLAEETKKKLRDEAREIIGEKIVPAFRRFHKFWTEEYHPNCSEAIGLSNFPNGAAWYRYLIKKHTTTDLSADRVHQIGLKEVAGIREQMADIIKQTGFKGSHDEFDRFLKTDARFYYNSGEELLAAYRDLCKRIEPQLPKIIGKLPRMPYGVRPVDQGGASGISVRYDYGSPAEGQASYLVVDTFNLKKVKKYQMEVVALHETEPGHHVQISLAMELENVPAFRKYYYYNSFIEGWALYAESLGEELGLYTDPYSKFGQLEFSIMRAVRLVVDTGLHAKGWSREKAIDYFKANTTMDEAFIRAQIDRYIVMPSQALSYKIGEREFRRLRRLYEKEPGDADIREFHDLVLEDGFLPLTVLARKMDRCIAEKKKKNIGGAI